MDSYQVVNVLRRFSRVTKGFPIIVCSVSELVKDASGLTETRGYVCNIGHHWVAVVLSKKKVVTYFDPLGKDMPQILKYALDDWNCIVNAKRFQRKGSRTCGLISVIFLIMYISRLSQH